MLLFQIVEFGQLKERTRYRIKMPEHEEFFIGYFCQYRGQTAVFRFVDRYKSKDDLNILKRHGYHPFKIFDERFVFKRAVYEAEQKRVLQAALEKRALAQIMESIVGHGF